MATTTSYVPLEVYLRSGSEYEPDAEYVDGVIEERPMGQWDHASWQQAIQFWFAAHAAEWNIRVRPELRIRVTPTRFRIPDVTVVDRNQPVEQILSHAPLAVFEVLSPEDTLPRTMRRLADFAAMGIAQIWVIDPETNSFYQFTDGKLSSATNFGSEGERIHFAMSEIEAFLD
jgi:Uma2 family endonuclease